MLRFTLRRIPTLQVRWASRKSRLAKETKKVRQEIRTLEHQVERQQKAREQHEGVTDQDIQDIYANLSTPLASRPKKALPTDFLQDLKGRYIDTRGLTKADEQTLLGAQTALTELQHKDAPGIADYNAVIYANALSARPNEAQQVVDLMKQQGLQPTLQSYNHLLDAFANAGDLAGAASTFKSILKQHVQPDTYTYSALIKATLAHGKLNDAFALFEQMKITHPVPSQPIFALLIKGCLQQGDIKRAWGVFNNMRLKYHQPDEVTYTLMLHACAKSGEVERAINLFSEMSAANLYPTDVTFNTLIHACAKRPDYVNEAFAFVEEMQRIHQFEPDLVTWNTLLMACAQIGDLPRAKSIIAHLLTQNLQPNERTWSALFQCYSRFRPAHTPQPTSSQLPGLVLDTDAWIDHVPTSKKNLLQEVQALYDREKSQLNTPALNAYLAVFIRHRTFHKAMHIYRHAFSDRDAHTYHHALQLAYAAKDAQFARDVWRDAGQLDTLSLTPDEAHALEYGRTRWMINTLARCEDVEGALDILEEYTQRTGTKPKLLHVQLVYQKSRESERQDWQRRLLACCEEKVGALAERQKRLKAKWGTW